MTCTIIGKISACSPLGDSWDETWEGFLSRESVLSNSPSIYDWPSGPPLGICSLGEQEVPYVNRMQFLICSVLKQISPQLDIVSREYSNMRLHIILASSHGDPGVATELRTALNSADFEQIVYKSHATIFRKLLNTIPHQFTTLHAACASGIVGAIQANDILEADLADCVLVISIDAISLLAYMGFRAVGAMDSFGCKPFGEESRGMSVGEGAVAILFTKKNSKSLSTRLRISMKGGAWNCDGSGGVEPSAIGLIDAILSAIERAYLRANDVDFIYWHGTGTKRNDEVELQVCEVLWPNNTAPAGASTKGNIGHTMGASAAFNIAAAYETLQCSVLPGLPYKSDTRFSYMNLSCQPRKLKRARNGLCVAMGFGGINAAIVIGRDS